MVTTALTIALKQHKSLITKNIVDKTGHLLVLLPAGLRDNAWPDFPYRAQLQARWKSRTASGKEQPFLATDLPNAAATRVLLTPIRADGSMFDTLSQARELLSAALADNPAALTVIMPGLTPVQQRHHGEAIVSAALAGCHAQPVQKKDPPASRRLRTIHIYGMEQRLDSARLHAEAAGNNLARALAAAPPNQLTPGNYRRRIKQLASEYGWRMQTLDSKALRRRKAGAFLAVTQGSSRDDAAIVRLSYTPPKRPRGPAIALVGKGLCYDTGGLNLKPARHMHGMHEDMTGSAVALGTLVALTRLKAPFAVECWLALAENHIGPDAYKQNDVVTAADGTGIEIIHTDAEGRMVLADTLYFASRRSPALIIDYATLTGTCIQALGTRYSGAFTNRPQLHPALITAGQACGERVWPFPLDEDFGEGLKSDVADIKQCSLDGDADHILAALFLQRFVQDTPWLHLDLAAGNHKGGLAHIPSDTTGFGVRYTLNLLLEQKLLDMLSS